MDTEVRQLEETLRVAMLSSDVAALDALIADALIFVGPSGEVFGKQDDLALHRSGRQKLSMAEWRSVDIVMHDQTAVALTTADLAGTFDGAAFSGRFRYCRFWGKKGGVWQVLGGSVLALPAAKEAIAQLP
ncbi:MAG: nuclear transport factor 2 family protein [Stenotrophomonas sp.]